MSYCLLLLGLIPAPQFYRIKNILPYSKNYTTRPLYWLNIKYSENVIFSEYGIYNKSSIAVAETSNWQQNLTTINRILTIFPEIRVFEKKNGDKCMKSRGNSGYTPVFHSLCYLYVLQFLVQNLENRNT